MGAAIVASMAVDWKSELSAGVGMTMLVVAMRVIVVCMLLVVSMGVAVLVVMLVHFGLLIMAMAVSMRVAM